MKAKYVVSQMLGSETRTNSLKSAKCLNAKSIICEDGKTIAERTHEFVGTIKPGIRFMPNIKLYKCSDTGDIITRLGEKKEAVLARLPYPEATKKSIAKLEKKYGELEKRRFDLGDGTLGVDLRCKVLGNVAAVLADGTIEPK